MSQLASEVNKQNPGFPFLPADVEDREDHGYQKTEKLPEFHCGRTL